MAAELAIPEDVVRFIEEFIDNVPQLETLLMMSESASRSWQVSDVAARNYISIVRAEQTLHALFQRGLLIAKDSPSSFRYAPASSDIHARVLNLARCYQSNLSRITSLIHSKPSASVKEFARAFDLKKDR